MPDDRFPAMAYWARVTLTVTGALALLAAAWKVRHILLLVLVAAVLAVGLDPQVRRLQRRRLSRAWAVTIILLLSIGLLVLFGWPVIPSAVRQTQQLARHTPDYLNRLQHATGFLGTLQRKYQLAEWLRETTARLPALALSKIPGITASAGSIIFNVLTVAVLMVYFLLGLPRGQEAAKALVAGQHADRNIRILEESLARIGGYVSGNLLISVIAGTLAFVVLEILRVPFAAAAFRATLQPHLGTAPVQVTGGPPGRYAVSYRKPGRLLVAVTNDFSWVQFSTINNPVPEDEVNPTAPPAQGVQVTWRKGNGLPQPPGHPPRPHRPRAIEAVSGTTL